MKRSAHVALMYLLSRIRCRRRIGTRMRERMFYSALMMLGPMAATQDMIQAQPPSAERVLPRTHVPGPNGTDPPFLTVPPLCACGPNLEEQLLPQGTETELLLWPKCLGNTSSRFYVIILKSKVFEKQLD